MYILECADGSYYVGSTRDLDQRVAQHLSGLGSRYTAGRLPVELVYAEEYDRIADAFSREKQVQKGLLDHRPTVENRLAGILLVEKDT
jgi:predicted GIY-YIG superfamily endonuclease